MAEPEIPKPFGFGTFEENKELLSGGGGLGGLPPTSTPSGGGAPAESAHPTTQTDSQPNAPPPLRTPQREATPSGKLSLPSYTPDPQVYGAFQGLFQPLTQGLQEGYKGLQGLTQGFNEAVDPYRSFEGLGAQETLKKALQPGADTSEAKKLVGATYEGPMGLQGPQGAQEDQLQKAVTEAHKLKAQGKALDSPQGTVAMLQRFAPGLTRGEARYETERLLGNESFRNARDQARLDISRLYGDLYGTMGTAKAIADRRVGEERDIAEKSRGFLEGEREALRAALGTRATELEAQDQAIRDQVAKFKETGNWQDLVGVAPEAAGFHTPYRQTLEEANVAWDQVMNAFPDIQHLPMLVLGIDGHGRELLMLPEGVTASPQELQRAFERHKAMVDAGFSPRSETYIRPEISIVSQAPGKYGTVKPLYFGTEYQPADLQPFVDVTGDMLATPENVATAEEVALYNTIQDILGSNQLMPLDATPFEVAQIMADVDRYLAEERAEREAAEAAGTEGIGEHERVSRRARRRYKAHEKGKAAKRLGQSLGGVGGWLAGGPILGPATAALGAYLGGDILEGQARRKYS